MKTEEPAGQLALRREKLLAQTWVNVPAWEPTDEDLNRMAAEDDEKYSEGHQHRPFPTNPHD